MSHFSEWHSSPKSLLASILEEGTTENTKKGGFRGRAWVTYDLVESHAYDLVRYLILTLHVYITCTHD